LISDPTQEMEDAYFSESKARYCHTSETNANAALNVTYTAMHGVGKPFITRVMQEFGLPAFIPVKEQIEIDPEFSTVAFPNPEEGKGALALAIKTAREHKSPVILANDPDADRLAVAELDAATGEYVPLDGNKIAVLLADWLWRWHMKKNPDCDKSKQLMVVSTVSGKILQGMANKEGFTFVDCLTGFKWMGNTAYSMEQEGYNFLFAYEVEIGFLPGNTSYDKDGVRTAGVFYELANDLYKQGKTLFQRLDELYAMYGYYFMKASYFFYPDVSITDVVFAALRDGGYPTSCGEFKIASVRDVTVGYDSAKPENKSTLPISPQMNMITFSFENGSVATLRPSGTEPKLKYYVESRSESSMDDAQVIVDAVEEALIKNFIQPDKYNMKAKANQN
jgi:phosphomannomutase